jgi:hypothetical protein
MKTEKRNTWYELPEVFNRDLKKRIKALETLCKKQKLTLYASHTDDATGYTVYKIKERPTFEAKFAPMRLL